MDWASWHPPEISRRARSASPGPAAWTEDPERAGIGMCDPAAAQRWAMAGAAGRDWPTPRLGRRSAATPQAGTDVALNPAAISPPPPPTVGQTGWARAGNHLKEFSLTGRVPATARTFSAGATEGVSVGWTSVDNTEGKDGVAESEQRGYERRSPPGPDPACSLTLDVTAAKKEPERRCSVIHSELVRASLAAKKTSPASCFPISAASCRIPGPPSPPRLTGTGNHGRCRSGDAGIHIQTSRRSGRGPAARKSGRGPAQTGMRKVGQPSHGAGRLGYGRDLAGRPVTGPAR